MTKGGKNEVRRVHLTFRNARAKKPTPPTLFEASTVIHILYKKQIGTHREKKHVLTLTIMLVRCKSACKTSAGSSKIFRWLAPLLGPNLDPKTGPKQRPKRKNENVIQFWTPFWGPYLDPKMGSAIGEFRCCPQMFCKDLRPSSLNMNVNTYLFLFVRPKAACYCRGPSIAAMF